MKNKEGIESLVDNALLKQIKEIQEKRENIRSPYNQMGKALEKMAQKNQETIERLIENMSIQIRSIQVVTTSIELTDKVHIEKKTETEIKPRLEQSKQEFNEEAKKQLLKEIEKTVNLTARKGIEITINARSEDKTIAPFLIENIKQSVVGGKYDNLRTKRGTAVCTKRTLASEKKKLKKKKKQGLENKQKKD